MHESSSEPSARPTDNLERSRILMRSSWLRLGNCRSKIDDLRYRYELTLAMVEETQRRIDRTDRLIASVQALYSR